MVTDYARRRLTAATARIIAAADRDGDCHDDGHRATRAWVNAHLRTSRRDATTDVRLAALGAAHPIVLTLLDGGVISVSHARALADSFANPRLHDAFARSVSWLCELATSSSFDVFSAQLHTWAQLADTDGPVPDPDEHRRAHIGTVADTTYLDAAIPGVAGAEVAEILERFTQAEFETDWERGRAKHGDAMCGALLERTTQQRRAGYQTWRDADGHWHTARPDGTTITPV